MPYVRQRSILQRAPRLKLARRRGMGQAECPSLEQLQGIADENDPCQNPIAALPVATVPPLSLTTSLTAAARTLGAVTPQSLDPLSGFLNTYKTPLMIGGGLLAGLLLLKALR